MCLSVITLTLVLSQTPPTSGVTAKTTPVAEKFAVHAAARDFRSTVYNTLRTDRAAFNRRWAAGENLWQEWLAAGQPAKHGAEVLAWFESAREAVVQGHGELPSPPELPAPTLTTSLEALPDNRVLPSPTAAPPSSGQPLQATTPENPAPPALDPAPTDDPPPAPPAEERPAQETPESAGQAENSATLPPQIQAILDSADSIFQRRPDRP